MEHKAKSIRPFIGAQNYEVSRQFYTDLGFKENIISAGMSYFEADGKGFYLQNYYAKDWINNTMIFLEVDDVARYYDALAALNLPARYPDVRLVPIKRYDWGSEFFLHDPSGVLWHFGKFLDSSKKP